MGENGRAAFFWFIAHIDDADEGEGLTVSAFGEGAELVFFFEGRVKIAFYGGGGGAEDDGGFF